MDRAPLIRPMSKMQEVVCTLLGLGMTRAQVAGHLRISIDMVKQHTKRASAKIPGDLPAGTRCSVWARGGSLDVLQGLTLRYEVTNRAAIRDFNGDRTPPPREEAVLRTSTF